MEDSTKAQLLQEIRILESQKGICSESDQLADEQISLYQQVIDRIREVKTMADWLDKDYTEEEQSILDDIEETINDLAGKK